MSTGISLCCMRLGWISYVKSYFLLQKVLYTLTTYIMFVHKLIDSFRYTVYVCVVKETLI